MQGPLGAIVASLRGRFQYPPQWDKTKAPAITPVREYLVGDVRPGLVATFAAMTLILLIACVNVAALMLGQVGSRATEMAVRSALGAGRHRLTQQLVIESLLVGALAGVTGALLAAAAFGFLVQSLPLGALAETAHARLDRLLDGDGGGAAGGRPHRDRSRPRALAGKPAVHDGDDADGRNLDARRPARRWAGRGADRAGRVAVGGRGPAAPHRREPARHQSRAGRDGAWPCSTRRSPRSWTPTRAGGRIWKRCRRCRRCPGCVRPRRRRSCRSAGRVTTGACRSSGRPDLDGGTTFVRLVTPDYFEALGIAVAKGTRLRGDRSRHDGTRRGDQRGVRERSTSRPRIPSAACCRPGSMSAASASSAWSATWRRRT